MSFDINLYVQFPTTMYKFTFTFTDHFNFTFYPFKLNTNLVVKYSAIQSKEKLIKPIQLKLIFVLILS